MRRCRRSDRHAGPESESTASPAMWDDREAGRRDGDCQPGSIHLLSRARLDWRTRFEAAFAKADAVASMPVA